MVSTIERIKLLDELLSDRVRSYIVFKLSDCFNDGVLVEIAPPSGQSIAALSKEAFGSHSVKRLSKEREILQVLGFGSGQVWFLGSGGLLGSHGFEFIINDC